MQSYDAAGAPFASVYCTDERSHLGVPLPYTIARTFGEECKANARLMSAAPDLLAALKAYVEWKGPCCTDDCPADDTCSCAGKPVNDMVNAAIAKARE